MNDVNDRGRGWRLWRSLRRGDAHTGVDAESTTGRTVLQDLAEGRDAVVPVQGSSMLPLIRSGDRVRVSPIRTPLRRGMIILFLDGRRFVLHRVVRTTPEGAITRGDFRLLNDQPVTRVRILGSARYVMRRAWLPGPLMVGMWTSALWTMLLPVVRTIIYMWSKVRSREV